MSQLLQKVLWNVRIHLKIELANRAHSMIKKVKSRTYLWPSQTHLLPPIPISCDLHGPLNDLFFISIVYTISLL